MNDKTPGQIAFEAHQRWNNYVRPWREISLSDQAQWEHIGQAVANAVAPLPEVEQ